jgi:hypothetical protein
MAPAVKTGSAVAAVATVAMAVADNNRNCRGRQQSTKCGSGSGEDSGRDSSNRGSAAATVCRGPFAFCHDEGECGGVKMVESRLGRWRKAATWRSTQISVSGRHK